MRASILRAALAACLGAAAFVALPKDPSANAADTSAGQRDFLEIYKVLESPRCMNCHPAGDAPLQGDKPHKHAMNVSRTSAASGLRCATCHRETNSTIPGAPPGAKGWNMPSKDIPMVFEGKSAHELCEQFKDPSKTSGRSLEQIGEHMGHDALVLWAWNPGGDRTTPPMSHDEMMKHVKGWLASGAPCPP